MTDLLERDHATPPSKAPVRPLSGPPRGRRGITLIGVAVGLALVASLVVLGARAWEALAGFSPFEQRVADRSSAPLLLALADLSDYHAAGGTFQVVLDLEQDTRFVPSLISGERTTFLATGEVDAIVDFGAVGERTVVSADRRAVTIALPAPRLDDVRVDPGASRVLSRDRGLVDRVGSVFEDNPTSERELYQLAEGKIADAATRSDLVVRAEQNTRQMLTALASGLGFTEVTVTFDAR